MSYLLPENLVAIDLNSDQTGKHPYLLFKDIEQSDGDEGQLNEPSYYAEGWVDSVHLDQESSHKQVCVFWVTPSGDEPVATNWRTLDEILLFEVTEAVYNEVKAHSEKLKQAYDKAHETAMQVSNDQWLEFDFDAEKRRYICRTDSTITVPFGA